MAYADQFELPKGIYLLNHSVGRPPAGIQSKVASSFFEAWRTTTPDPWSHWLDVVEDFRGELAKMLNGRPQEFCPQANLSSGFTKILQSLKPTDGRTTLLVSQHDFPSMGFVAKQAGKWGLSLRWLPEDFEFTSSAAWQEQIREDLLAVFISHVHYNSNTRVPVAEIAEAARARGVFSIVDIAQSVGVVPIDVSHWQADVVLGSCVKWLCGGPGAGFVWVSQHAIHDLEPKDVGWFSHANPFEFDIHHFEYADDALRFWGGTPSVLPFEVARHSIKMLRSIGIETIYRHNRELTDRLISALEERDLVTPIESDHRGGTLVISPPDQEQIAARLSDAGVHFDARAMGMRLSPHIYNSIDEIEQVVSCLAPR